MTNINLTQEQLHSLMNYMVAINKSLPSGKNRPEKLELADCCFGKIAIEASPSAAEVIGLLDSIGGYVSATTVYVDKYANTKEEKREMLADALRLLDIAREIERQALEQKIIPRRIPVLHIVRNHDKEIS